MNSDRESNLATIESFSMEKRAFIAKIVSLEEALLENLHSPEEPEHSRFKFQKLTEELQESTVLTATLAQEIIVVKEDTTVLQQKNQELIVDCTRLKSKIMMTELTCSDAIAASKEFATDCRAECDEVSNVFGFNK